METIKTVEVSLTRRYRLVEKQCPVCGVTFTGSPLRVYCESRCAKKAGWQRHGKRYNDTRREKRSSEQ